MGRGKPPNHKTYNAGDTVMAKWSGSNAYYEAKILSIADDSCEVKFKDGTVNSLSLNHLKPITSTPKKQSPSRAARSPRSRSRSRSRSQTTQSTRKRSTSRSSSQTRSPRKRSTSRSRASAISAAEEPDRSLPSSATKDEKPEYVRNLMTDLEERNLRVVLTPLKASLRSHSSATKKNEGESQGVIHRISTARRLVLEENEKEIGSLVNVNQKQQPVTEVDGRIKIKTEYRLMDPVFAFAQMIIMPCLVFYLYMACTKDHCPLFWIPVIPRSCSSYYDPVVYLAFLAWVIVQAILVAFPIGQIVEGLPSDDPAATLKPPKFRMNGFVALILTICGLSGISLLLGPSTLISEKIFQLLVVSVVYSFLLSIVLYIKSWYAPKESLNPKALTGCAQYDFFYGRELYPCLGERFSFKVYCVRLGLIGWVILNLILLYSYLLENPKPNYSLFVTAAMQIIYVAIDYLQEETMVSTYSFRREYYGYFMVMGMATMVPFIYVLPTVYLANHAVDTSQYILVFCGIVYFVGLYIAKKSSRVKHAFRVSPHDPKISLNSEVILTGKKKNLLSSGLWGFVRHPNYLGEILMFAAWSFPCGFHHWIPYFPVMFLVLGLCIRALQIDNDSNNRYGPAWKLYAQKVRWRILPYIF